MPPAAPKNRLLVATAIGFLSVIVASAYFAPTSADIAPNFAIAPTEFDGQVPAYILNSPYDMLGCEFE